MLGLISSAIPAHAAPMRQHSTRAGPAPALLRWERLARVLSPAGRPRRARAARGYLAAAAGVALATVLIGLILRAAHISNISLLYLIVVLWLAATFGRGPAIAASVLAFFAFDFFFIPPLHRFTINDGTEWLSLSAFLATAIVSGSLTAAIQHRAEEAIESQRRTAVLYESAQLIISREREDDLLRALAELMLRVFAPAGVAACSVILADANGWPMTRAAAPADGPWARALDLTPRERMAQAATVLKEGASAGSTIAGGEGDEHGTRVLYYLPLRTSRRVVGVLGLAGEPSMRALVAGFLARAVGGEARATTASDDTPDPRAGLFTAMTDQIALAVERVELQRAAIHAEALRESDQLKDALLGSVTHDLRTPLAVIQTSAESLLDPAVEWSATERHDLAETIKTSVDRLNRLVSNLLDLSRLEAGVAAPEKHWYPIGDVIATVLDQLDLLGRTAGRRIDILLPDDLPLVPLDHAQIEQVMINLLENALKYSPDGSPIVVSARLAGTPPMLEVRVTDHGLGIPAGELRAIFGKFYRVQQATPPWAHDRPPTGTGLGLAICASIIHAHGGRIWAESEPGKGATFVFTLPAPAQPTHATLEDGAPPRAEREA
jgi:two-component system sensor histidine kinase KdpD